MLIIPQSDLCGVSWWGFADSCWGFLSAVGWLIFAACHRSLLNWKRIYSFVITCLDILQLHKKEPGEVTPIKGSIVVDWKMNGYCSMKPTCGAVTLRTWGWRKWTLWPVCRSEGQTGTLAAFLESPAAYTHKEKHSIKWLTYDQIHCW